MRSLFVALLSLTLLSLDSLAGVRRGGGDSLEIITQIGGVPIKLVSTESKASQDDYQKQFCACALSGLQKVELSNEDRSQAAAKLNAVCSSSQKLRLNSNIPMTAYNYPDQGTIDLNPIKWDANAKFFTPQFQMEICEALSTHEILSLIGIEKSQNYAISSTLISNKSLIDLRNQNSLEAAIGQMALFFEVKNISQPDGIFPGYTFNQIRDQLMSFSPLFDEEILATVDINYKNEYRARKSARGNEYVIGRNEHLLEPVLKRIQLSFQKLGIQIKSGVKPSWAVAVQLHQLLLALIDPPYEVAYLRSLFQKNATPDSYFSLLLNQFSEAKQTGDEKAQKSALNNIKDALFMRWMFSGGTPAGLNKTLIDVMRGYTVVIEQSSFMRSNLDIDTNRKQMIIRMDDSVDEAIESMSKHYSFEVVEEGRQQLYQGNSTPVIKFNQSWPAIYMGQDSGKMKLMQTNGIMLYYPENPAYLESFLLSSVTEQTEFSKRNSGIQSATKIRDLILAQPDNKDFYKFGQASCSVDWLTTLNSHKLTVSEDISATLDDGKRINLKRGQIVYFMNRGSDRGQYKLMVHVEGCGDTSWRGKGIFDGRRFELTGNCDLELKLGSHELETPSPFSGLESYGPKRMQCYFK